MDSAIDANHISPPAQGLWARAVGEGGDPDANALRELAGTYWYCVYAWWRRSGLDPVSTVKATIASFEKWLSESPPCAEDSGVARLRDWMLAQFSELAEQGVKLKDENTIVIDPSWAEKRYAEEPEGDSEAIFQRRWALTVIEASTTTLRDEYAARGEEKLYTELLGFVGYEQDDSNHYSSVAERLGQSSGAIRKAVFEFRTRQRDILLRFVADTVFDPADADSEITALLCACDAPGPDSLTAPLPSAIQGLRPDDILVRAMRSVKMTRSGSEIWQTPSIDEASRLFPNYEIVALVGRGGMGAVYKGRQVDLDREVAIKLLPLEVSVDPSFADRFRREARAMAKLNHPNIILIHEFGTTYEGHLFFVMEYVEGADLHQMIHGQGVSPAQSLSIITGVCDALSYAHSKGVVHRDIKPANVMISIDGEVKVADFGLARLLDPSEEQKGFTVTGTVMGTPDYMAPEQMKGMNVDHRADIYSLGVMLYEMVCGEIPRGIFDPPSARVSGVDTRIDQVVIRAMQQQPDRRYQSTSEMKTDVSVASEVLPPAEDKLRSTSPETPAGEVQAAPTKPEPQQPIKARAATRKTDKLIYGGIALAVAALLGIFLMAGSGKPKETPQDGKSDSTPLGEIATTNPVKTSKESPFINSLGMQFVSVPITGGPTDGKNILFSIWETRRSDYERFVKATQRDWPIAEWQMVEFVETPDHPAVTVNWDDAVEFCKWLTKEERQSGKIGKDAVYRLPKDHEWSCAVGIGGKEDPTKSPEEKSGVIKGYLWGTVWPPPDGFGNLYGEETINFPQYRTFRPFAGYRDPFPRTAPVGSFKPSELGLYDLIGNVSEWCEEEYSEPFQNNVMGTLRGASYYLKRIPNMSDETDVVHTSKRIGHPRIAKYEFNGFRVVLELPVPAAGGAISPSTSGTAPDTSSAKSIVSATKDSPFVNSLGMKFVPVPITGGPSDSKQILFSVWETRVMDYEQIVKERRWNWPKPNYERGADYPAENVSWVNAKAFCEWLTLRERAAGKIGVSQQYRLPTDHEWSCAVGIGDKEDPLKFPNQKSGGLPDIYPWGNEWPPPEKAGNYNKLFRDDGFANTSPVGSFAVNPLGLYDMSGNVAEWCEDLYDLNTRVMRGFYWQTSLKEKASFLSSTRFSNPSDFGGVASGFRIVLDLNMK